jgi:hypothetical protein
MAIAAASRSLLSPSSVILEDGNRVLSEANGDAVKTVWGALANGDSGSPVSLVQYADRSVQVEGTFGVGGTLLVEGSNDGTTYHTLTDSIGNPLSFTTSGLKVVSEATGFIRPRVSAGDGTTAIVVTMVAAR